MTCFIALDVGIRRVGVAISHNGIFATPHTVLYRKSKTEDFHRLRQIAEELKAEKIIVGLPYSLSGYDKIGPQAKRIMRYTREMAKIISIPIEYFDESYSTADAKSYLSDSHSTTIKRNKTLIDAIAATVILQNYLNNKIKDKSSEID